MSANLSGFDTERNQAILRSELDQEVREAWEEFYWHGEEWIDRFSMSLDKVCEARQSNVRAVGRLARIGFLHMLESYVPGDVSGDTSQTAKNED